MGSAGLPVVDERDEGAGAAVGEVVAAVDVLPERVHAQPVHPLGAAEEAARHPQRVGLHLAGDELLDVVGHLDDPLPDDLVGQRLGGGVELGDRGHRQASRR